MNDSLRESLHSDAENRMVWCERCGREHRYYTFTREDYDRVIAEGVAKLAAAIDADIAARVYAEVLK